MACHGETNYTSCQKKFPLGNHLHLYLKHMINVGVLINNNAIKKFSDMWTVGLAIMSFFPDIFYQQWNKTNYEMKTSATEPSVRSGNGGMHMTMAVISILP